MLCVARDENSLPILSSCRRLYGILNYKVCSDCKLLLYSKIRRGYLNIMLSRYLVSKRAVLCLLLITVCILYYWTNVGLTIQRLLNRNEQMDSLEGKSGRNASAISTAEPLLREEKVLELEKASQRINNLLDEREHRSSNSFHNIQTPKQPSTHVETKDFKVTHGGFNHEKSSSFKPVNSAFAVDKACSFGRGQKTIVGRLNAGLGNHMFMYAGLLGLAKTFNRTLVIRETGLLGSG